MTCSLRQDIAGRLVHGVYHVKKKSGYPEFRAKCVTLLFGANRQTGVNTLMKCPGSDFRLG